MSETSNSSPRTRRSIFPRFAALALFALSSAVALTVLTNCSSNSATTSSPTFTTVYNETLSQPAGCEGCHNPSGSAYLNNGVRLDFSSLTQAYITLNGTKVVGQSSVGTCGQVLDVSPGNPTASYIVATIIPSYSTANFGGQAGCTPYAGHTANLTATEQSDLTGWISAGAMNN